jgi:hypothetical protein
MDPIQAVYVNYPGKPASRFVIIVSGGFCSDLIMIPVFLLGICDGDAVIWALTGRQKYYG